MVSAALVTRILLKLRVSMAEILAIFIGTCGALMIFQKDIFVIEVEDQSRFMSNVISNNVSQTESGYFINNGTFLVTNNGSLNANMFDHNETSIKILNSEMDGRTTQEKTNHLHLMIGIVLSAICGLCNPCKLLSLTGDELRISYQYKLQ